MTKRKSIVLDSSKWSAATKLRSGNIAGWAWDTSNPTAGRLRIHAYQPAIDAAVSVQKKRAELEASKRYTPQGVRDELTKFVEASVHPSLEDIKKELIAVRGEIKDRREKIKPKTIESDKENPAAAMRRIEARTVMRSMSHREKVRLLAGEQPDPLFVEAALEAPGAASGIPPSLYGVLQNSLLQAQFGDEIAELDELEQALESVIESANTAAASIDAELSGVVPLDERTRTKTDAERKAERAARVQFVEEHGADAYLNRAKIA